MICIAIAGAKRTRQTRLLAEALSKSSDFLIGTQGKSYGLGCLRQVSPPSNPLGRPRYSMPVTGNKGTEYMFYSGSHLDELR
jgi:hypothetical protein